MSKRSFGFSLLADQVADHLAAEYEFIEKDDGTYSTGDTAIERLLYAAVRVRCQIGACEYELWTAPTLERLRTLRTEKTNCPRLIVAPQFLVKKRRVDFLFTAFDYGANKGVWRELLVECDGHDYHERTKEQAAKDRAKDREAVLAGYEFFRFTGSELWRDPWGCAAQITDWAAGGLP